MSNGVIFSAVREEAEKLIRRHQKYLSDLAANIRRKERRSGLAIAKTMHMPGYWSVNEGFNPYHVKSHAAGIAYAIEKALASGQYRPRPAAKYVVPKGDGGSREVSVFQVADNAVSNLTFGRLIEKNARHLSAHAYAYRRDLTVHDAVLHVYSDFQGKSRIFVAEFDFSKFFDSIAHEHIHRVLAPDAERHRVGVVALRQGGQWPCCTKSNTWSNPSRFCGRAGKATRQRGTRSV
jgi:RNA-directed DNA polymerase